VVSAPSGTGKTTVCHRLLSLDPELRLSVSHTTRSPRPNERDGADYHFVSRPEFEDLLAAGAFLEHAEYRGNLYGTSLAAVEGPLAEGRDLLLEIEVQGARQLRVKLPEARLVFLLPPSREELERRLRARGTESDEAIARRLAIAAQELTEVVRYDYAVVNDDLEVAVARVREIVRGERRGERAALEARFRPDAVLAEIDGLPRLLGGK
jgi:guanylate kinase